MKDEVYQRSLSNKRGNRLSKFGQILHEALEGEPNYNMDIDCIQWNYKEGQIEIIEGNYVSEASYKRYRKEMLFNYGNNPNILWNKDKTYYAKGFRKKILLQWNLIKDIGKGKLILLFWSDRKDSFQRYEITNIDESKEEHIEFKDEESVTMDYKEFKKWFKKWNLQGKKKANKIC